jgi:hypothetical protein
MKLQELRSILQAHPDALPRFILPDGDEIPAHFHLTEVGHVAKNFIDCGGTIRQSEACVLQLWVNDDDLEHRLSAGKFASILALGERVLPHPALEAEVEWDCCVTSQYPIASFSASDDRLEFMLSTKHTDCLAKEKCGVEDDGCGCRTAELKNEQAAAACC